MKLVARSLLIGTVVLLASSVLAQVPHLTPFSADMQMSSMQAGPANRDMSGKLYVDQQAMRMDMSGEGAHQAIIITSFATQTVDIVMPQQHMYMEHRADENTMHRGPNTSDVHPYDPKNPCASDPGSTCKNLGTETVNGRSADHWQVTHKDGNVSDVWIDNSLHFPIKTVSGGTTWQLTNIKEGPQDASLFQVPAGYRNMEMPVASALPHSGPPPGVSLPASADQRQQLAESVTKYLAGANSKSGWSSSPGDTTFDSETVNAEGNKAFVVARVVFKGGSGVGIAQRNGARMAFGPTIGPASPLEIYGVAVYPKDGLTYLRMSEDFSLIMEDGAWKVTEPLPKEPPVAPM